MQLFFKMFFSVMTGFVFLVSGCGDEAGHAGQNGRLVEADQNFDRQGLEVSQARFCENPDHPGTGLVFLTLADTDSVLGIGIEQTSQASDAGVEHSFIEYTHDGLHHYALQSGHFVSQMIEAKEAPQALIIHIEDSRLEIEAQGESEAYTWLIDNFSASIEPELCTFETVPELHDYVSNVALIAS